MRDYKGYKTSVSKKRTALGSSHADGSDPTAIRLQNVNANAALQDWNNLDLEGEEKFLRSFGDDAEVKWATKFATDLATAATRAAPIASNFKCFIGPLEDVLSLSLAEFKDRLVQFQLRKKHVIDGDICLYDEGEDDDGNMHEDRRKTIDMDRINR